MARKIELLSTQIKNEVLDTMAELLQSKRDEIIVANRLDLDHFDQNDQALYDRLKINDAKIDGMIEAVNQVRSQQDPINMIIEERKLDSGLKIENRKAPFGSILIIYESRPDVTIEAAVLAFKANNRILLKGGKEAKESNKVLVNLWHQALSTHGLDEDWIQYLELDRIQTQEFLKNPNQPLDLIVPRGGEGLINFVKRHASCAVLVSGRGNNFLYVHEDADWEMTLNVIINAKTQKISACNALDKILISQYIEDLPIKLKELITVLESAAVDVLVSKEVTPYIEHNNQLDDFNLWYEEFLAMKCLIGVVSHIDEAITMINKYSGGHSSAIMSKSDSVAHFFMTSIDSAAVYHNASTRFTDGGQMGVGAELAISTDKLHHRGPLGLNQLTTNKYFVYGNGHIRES